MAVTSTRMSAAYRWAERTVTRPEPMATRPAPAADQRKETGRGREHRFVAGVGPYEVHYDVCRGYNHDRTILLP